MDSSVLERLKSLLDEHSVEHEIIDHAPVFTSEDAAAARGTPIMCGAKALVCKVGRSFADYRRVEDPRQIKIAK